MNVEVAFPKEMWDQISSEVSEIQKTVSKYPCIYKLRVAQQAKYSYTHAVGLS